jgi:hypothetical protein
MASKQTQRQLQQQQVFSDPYAAYATPDPRRNMNLTGEDAGPVAMDQAEDEEGEALGDDEIATLLNGTMELREADDGAEDVEMRTYHSAKDVISNLQEDEATRKKLLKVRSAKRKPKSARVWKPNGQYKLVRRGRPLIHDPDAMGKDLCEENFYYFEHVALEDGRHVEFAADPNRPLWKGVFKVPVEYGCGADEYWNPTQSNYKVIYGPREVVDENGDASRVSGRDKAGQPDDNMLVLRDGTALPYWVDEWQRYKDNDTEHKMASRQKKEARRRAVLGPGPVIRPLQGAMLEWVASQQPPTGSFNAGAFLRASPANQMANRMGPGAIRAMKRVPLPAGSTNGAPPNPFPLEPVEEEEDEEGDAEEAKGGATPAQTPVPVAVERGPIVAAPEQTSHATNKAAETQRMEAFIKMKEEMEAQKLAFAKEKAEYIAAHAKEPKPAPIAIIVPVSATTPAPVPVKMTPVPTGKPLAGLPPNPLLKATVLPPPDVVIRNGPLMLKLRYAYMARLAEDEHVMETEALMDDLIGYLVFELSTRTQEVALRALLRKAKYALLAKEDLGSMTDTEHVVKQFLVYAVAKAEEIAAAAVTSQ